MSIGGYFPTSFIKTFWCSLDYSSLTSYPYTSAENLEFLMHGVSVI